MRHTQPPLFPKLLGPPLASGGPQGPFGERSGDAGSEAGLSGNGSANGSSVSKDAVQDLIDAVAGATWNTRNRIMEERFLAALDKGEAKVPAFKPPGEALGGS